MKNTAAGIFFIDSDHYHVISNRFPYKSDIAAHGWDNSFAVEFDFLRSSSVLMWLETNSDTLLIQKTLKTDSLHSFASPWPNDKPKEDSQTRGQPNLGGRPEGHRATCINLDLHDNERRWKWKRSKLLVSFNTVVWATYQNMLRIY